MLKKISWGHGVAIALGTFMLFILGLIFYFTSTMSNSELITENYYEEELEYQKVIDAKTLAEQLPEKPQYIQNEEGIRIVFPATINNNNSTFRIDLHRADDQRLDIIRDMKLDQKNSIFVPANVIVKGHYVLRMHWTKDQKNYQLDYDLEW